MLPHLAHSRTWAGACAPTSCCCVMLALGTPTQGLKIVSHRLTVNGHGKVTAPEGAVENVLGPC